jgi:hypothetical protein
MNVQAKNLRMGTLLRAVLAVVLLAFQFSSYAAPPVPRTVLMLSFDALDLRPLNRLKAAGKLPALAELNIVPMFGGPVTVTKPGHAEVLTGLAYNVTGVRTNEDFDSKIQPEWTIFGMVKRERPDTFVSAIFSKPNHTGDGYLYLTDGRKEPYYYLGNWARAGGINAYFSATALRPQHDLSTEETMSAVNQQIDQFIAWHQISHRWEYFMYVHFAQPDEIGHQFGRGSAEWDAAVIQLDSVLGQLRDRLNPEAVFVYSDHGFDAPLSRNHGHAPAAFLASNFPLKRHGNRVDVVPTICEVLELPWRSYRPWLLGRSLLLR